MDQRINVYQFAVYDIFRQFPDEAPDAQAQAMIDQLNDRTGKLVFSASRRLVEVNRQGLQQFMTALSPGAAAELKRRYNEEAYPEVYPDPAFAGPYFDAANALEGLDKSQLAMLEALREQYNSEHIKASSRWAEAIYHQRAVNLRHELGPYDEQAAEAEQEIARVGLEREALNLAQPGRIRAMLLPEQAAKLRPWIYETQPPPRPWARLAHVPDRAAEFERQRRRQELRERHSQPR